MSSLARMEHKKFFCDRYKGNYNFLEMTIIVSYDGIKGYQIIDIHHSDDIESLLSKGSASTTVKYVCSYSLFKNEFRKKNQNIFNVTS